MIIRQDIESLTTEELIQFRDAFRKLQSDATINGFQAIAGLHGLPNPANCPHHELTFLPWHRLYVLQLERALSLHGWTKGLPYWDWASESAQQNGIPSILTVRTYQDSSGVEHPNPLFSSQVDFENRHTRRGNPDSSVFIRLAKRVERANRESVFYSSFGGNSFSSLIEGPHDSVHVSVGGDMGSVAYAAYDPIFWLHHCNVDRQWAEWQVHHPDVELPSWLQELRLSVYELPVKDTLNFKGLGYTYDSIGMQSPIHFELTVTPLSLEGVVELPSFNSPLPAKNDIVVTGLKMTKESFELRVFADQDDADHETPINDNPNFIGEISLLGMGEAMNPRGFRGTFERRLDIGEARLILNAAGNPMSLKIVPVNLDGKPVTLDSLGMSIGITEDRER